MEGVVTKLTSKIDLAAAKSAELKGEVKTLGAELAALAKEQAEMDSIRAEEKAAYDKAKAELSAGIAGVGKALGVLRGKLIFITKQLTSVTNLCPSSLLPRVTVTTVTTSGAQDEEVCQGCTRSFHAYGVL